MIEYETVPPPDGGCRICWMDEERGLLVKTEQLGVWVHPACLDYFDVDNALEFEREYIDTDT